MDQETFWQVMVREFPYLEREFVARRVLLFKFEKCYDEFFFSLVVHDPSDESNPIALGGDCTCVLGAMNEMEERLSELTPPFESNLRSEAPFTDEGDGRMIQTQDKEDPPTPPITDDMFPF